MCCALLIVVDSVEKESNDERKHQHHEHRDAHEQRRPHHQHANDDDDESARKPIASHASVAEFVAHKQAGNTDTTVVKRNLIGDAIAQRRGKMAGDATQSFN